MESSGVCLFTRTDKLWQSRKLLGEPAFELRKKFMNQGIPVRIGPGTKENLLAEMASAEDIKSES